MVKNILKALMYNLNLATSTILMLLSRHIGVVNSLITCISLPYYHGRQYMACWYNCCFKEGGNTLRRVSSCCPASLCEDKTNMRQMESRISETVKHNIFQEKFLRFKEQPHHVGDKKHTEHKVVRCWWSYTTKHKLVASQSTVRKLTALDFPQTSNITSLHCH